jgi:hypothetical protein
MIKPDQMVNVHHGRLDGPLYQNEDEWRFVYRLVKSFTRAGVNDAACIFDKAFGQIAAPLDHVMDELPVAFARQDFAMQGSVSPNGRRALFRASESSRVDALPEPYGKWLQHRKREPRWGKPVDVEVKMFCILTSPAPGVTLIRIEASTFALGTLVELGRQLTEQLDLLPPLATTLEYLRSRTQFSLRDQLVDLQRLK